MSCLSWRHIFHESWENKSKFQMGGLRETGGLPLFSPEGRTYSPPVKQAVVCLRHRALSEGDFAFCGKRQTMPQHLRMLLSSSARLGKYRRFNRRYFPTACANLPPAALPQRWTGVLPVHFLFGHQREPPALPGGYKSLWRGREQKRKSLQVRVSEKFADQHLQKRGD